MANVNVLLFLLYFGQGLPYGFQVKLLPLLLRKENFSLSKVGLSRLLSLPWIFKFSVAPLIDNLWSLNSWIVFGSIAMSLLCFISAFMGVSSIMIILFCVFWMNLTSALQDVAVDAFAISLLKPSELGEKFLMLNEKSLKCIFIYIVIGGLKKKSLILLHIFRYRKYTASSWL